MSTTSKGLYRHEDADLSATSGSAAPLLNKLAGSMDQAWATFVPSIAGTPTAPAVSSAAGRYKQMGSLIVVRERLVIGASAGAGTWTLALPKPSEVTIGAVIGYARLYRNAGGGSYPWCPVALQSASAAIVQYQTAIGGSMSSVGAAAPWAWAAGDVIDAELIYEATA